MEPLSSNDPPPPEGEPSSSLGSRIMNVFAAPGEAFDSIKHTPTAARDWLVPLTLSILAGILYTLVVFSQSSVLQGIRESQEKALQTQVKAGKMSQQDADRAMEMMQKFSSPTVMKVAGVGGAVGIGFPWLFLVGTILWLFGVKVFKGSFPYMKGVEAAALAGMIPALGGVVAMLLVVMTGNMAVTPGPALLIRNLDVTNKFHALLSQLNLFTLWYVLVLAMGLSRLSGAAYVKCLLVPGALWAALVAAALVFQPG